MKRIIRYISICATLTTLLVHSAADEAPAKPIDEITVNDLVGFCCSDRGNCEIITTLNKQRHDPSLSVTVVYSEHAVLKTPAVLKGITRLLDAEKTFDSYEAFQELCDRETSKHIAPVINNLGIIGNANPRLIALCLNIGPERIKEVGCIVDHDGKFPSSGQGSYHWVESKRLTAYSSYSSRSDDHVDVPQEETEKLQSEDPKKPFHLIINLALWKQITESRRKELRRERKRAFAAMLVNDRE